MNDELRNAINAEAKRIGADPLDFATAISYETGGTFDPWKKGPTTQWGRHEGLIQMGGPQRKQFGYTPDKSVALLVASSADYLVANGFKPGMGLHQLYATINTGSPNGGHKTDENNGGAPGTSDDKVNNQMAGHRKNAAALLGGTYQAITASRPNGSADIGMPSVEVPDWRTNSPRPPEVETAETGWWQLQSDAYNTQQTLPWLGLQNKQIAPDLDWSLDPNRVKQDLELRGVPESEIERYTPRLASVSEADYQDNLGIVKDDWDRNVRLSQAGLSGTALSIANSILDPVALGADLLAATAAPALVIGNRGRRLGRVLEGAMAGAAGGAASTAINAAVNPNVNQSDLLMATVFGAGVGGAVGHLFGRPETTFEATRIQRAGRNAVDNYEGSLANTGSVGAAKASPAQPFLDEDGLGLLDDRDFSKTLFGALRPDLSARLQRDSNVLVKAGAGLVQDGTGKADGAVNSIAASEDMTRLFEEKRIHEAQTYTAQLREYAKTRKGGAAQIEREFNDKIDAYLRDRRPGRSEHYDPAVIKAGNKQAELYADALKLQQNPFLREGIDGRPVLGTESIQTDPHFAPRFWDSQRLTLANREFADGTIEDLIGRAMKSADTGLKDELIARTSKAFTKAIVDRAHGLEDLSSHTLGVDKLDSLIDMLQDNYGLIKEDADALRFEFRKSKDAGRDGHNKQRLLLDESFRVENVMRRDGTIDERGIGISDLISTDARQNFTRYMRNTMGRVALARYRFKDPQTGELLINGFTSDNEFAQYIKKVREKNADLLSQGKITKAEGELGIKRLEFAYATILGRPTSAMEATNTGWTLRMIRKFNFARIMNQVGLAQISEIGAPIASLGWKAALSQAPALRRIVTDDGASLLKSGLGDDLEAILGVGGDRLLQTSEYRLDDLTGIHEEPAGSWKDAVEGALNRGNHITSEISGLTQANIMLERWTAAAVVQKFSNMAAAGGKGMSAKRLADLGLDKDMTARVMKMFNTVGNFEHTTGFITGKKVVRAHFDKWSDKPAREAFIQAAHRLSRQIIQKNDIGNMAMWMSHPMAKAFMQFRTFMVGSYGKQTLKSIGFHDMTAFHHLIMTTAFATAGYIMQMKLQAMGRADGEKFLEDRLSPDNLAAAGFARSGVSSIIPMLVDTGRFAMKKDPWFSFTRSTGQVSDAVMGNPTTGLLTDIPQATRSISGLFEDREWSQEEARNLVRVLPFGNALPIVMGLNGMIADQPQRAPR
ncbi:MAG: hypothetical protein EOR00_09550 [Mesorhizobium sp.]|uniref:hypothetical protein n=1 Tax=Mesorhizobium sp. TaxID=1871066 RepID=UPI000FE7D669|nr:hypothetical protein [Mesorhizobium sp.]RWP18871.1 MAG: hypothetical protein EOR00_09550 [Mesorhizobium sp.]